MIVQFARHEAAEHKVWPFEGLMRRRRPMDAIGDRLEVANVEGIRVEIAIPAYQIERMLIILIRHQFAVDTNAYFELARFTMLGQLLRQPEIALTIWRTFQHLTK